MEDFTFDLGIKPSSKKMPITSAAKKVAVPAARALEGAASAAVGGIIPQAAVGLTNLASHAITGEQLLPSYEEIYSKYVPSLRTVARGAEHLARSITGYNQWPKELQNRPSPEQIAQGVPDIGPLAPAEKFREAAKPFTGKLTEPEGAVENILSDVGELTGVLSNPSKWISKGPLLGDLLKAGSKAVAVKGAGKVASSFGGEPAGAIAELLTLAAVGAGENKGLVDTAQKQKYGQWSDFLNKASQQRVPHYFPKGPVIQEFSNFLKEMKSGLGAKDPARAQLIPLIEEAIAALGKNPTAQELDRIRKGLSNNYNKIKAAGGEHFWGQIYGKVNDQLGRWASKVPGGKQAFNELQQANLIHQGRFITEKVGNIAKDLLKKGNLHYGLAYAAASPFVALSGLKVKPIRQLWWKAWKEGAQGKIPAMQRTLRQFDAAIAKKFPNIINTGQATAESPQQQENDFEFTL